MTRTATSERRPSDHERLLAALNALQDGTIVTLGLPGTEAFVGGFGKHDAGSGWRGLDMGRRDASDLLLTTHELLGWSRNEGAPVLVAEFRGLALTEDV